MAENEGFRFNGPSYDPELDQRRLTGQALRIFDLMKDGCWRTLDQIATKTGDPHASISAQLRHFRKPRFGSHTVDKQRIGDERTGLYAYKLIPNPDYPVLGNPE